MEKAILDQNQKHFTQAKTTTFTKEPFSEYLGDIGTTEIADNILKGIIPDDLLEFYQTSLLKAYKICSS
jgi:hypothetical protein